eukprot:g18000.t1
MPAKRCFMRRAPIAFEVACHTKGVTLALPLSAGPFQGEEDDQDDVVATDEASIIQLRSSQAERPMQRPNPQRRDETVRRKGCQSSSFRGFEESTASTKLTGDWDVKPVLSEESSEDPGFFEVSPVNKPLDETTLQQ